MRLIFVRHGKAQERGSVEDDFKRELVQKGVEQAENVALQIKPLITRCSNVYIWSSSKYRAWQTAKVIEDILDIHYIQQKDFIADGDIESLIEDIGKLDGTDCIILVGHEPHLGDWTKEICGRHVDYKKGQAAIMELRDGQYVEGSLVVLQKEK